MKKRSGFFGNLLNFFRLDNILGHNHHNIPGTNTIYNCYEFDRTDGEKIMASLEEIKSNRLTSYEFNALFKDKHFYDAFRLNKIIVKDPHHSLYQELLSFLEKNTEAGWYIDHSFNELRIYFIVKADLNKFKASNFFAS